MTDASHTADVLPNRETATHCNPAPWISAVMRVAHKLWRHDTRTKLRDATMASERTVDYWRAKRRPQMSADHLVGLMRAEPSQFVPAVLGDHAYQALRREIVRQAVEELKAAQDAQQRLIERLECGE